MIRLYFMMRIVAKGKRDGHKHEHIPLFSVIQYAEYTVL